MDTIKLKNKKNIATYFLLNKYVMYKCIEIIESNNKSLKFKVKKT